MKYMLLIAELHEGIITELRDRIGTDVSKADGVVLYGKSAIFFDMSKTAWLLFQIQVVLAQLPYPYILLSIQDLQGQVVSVCGQAERVAKFLQDAGAIVASLSLPIQKKP